MAELLTRPYMRDAIRRMLQIVPPADNGTGVVGAQPSYAPFPTNRMINQCLQFALTDINNICKIHVTQFTSVDVDAQASTTPGPFGWYMGDLTPNTDGAPGVNPVGLLNDILRLVWDDGSGNLVRLQPRDRFAEDRAGSQYLNTYPGTPQYYYVEGYVIYIWPAQSTSGNYILTCGTGFLGLQGENDVIDQFPIDFQPTLLYRALWHLSIMMTQDLEAAQRAASYGPLALQGLAMIEGWKRNLTGPQQPTLGVLSYNRGYGITRTRR